MPNPQDSDAPPHSRAGDTAPSPAPPPIPASNSSPSPDGGGFASIAGVLALILAALQVIPAYVPRALWTFVIVGVCVLGLVVYIITKLRNPDVPDRSKKLAFVALLFALACFSGYQIYSLRSELTAARLSHASEVESIRSSLEADLASTREQLARCTGSLPLQNYLAAVVDEGSKRWNGEFEARYARPTLYLLNPGDVTTQNVSPMRVQEQLLLWRIGTARIGKEFRGVASLVGDVSVRERNELGLFTEDSQPLDPERVASGILKFVDRPLADSDLLNKNPPTPEGGAPSPDSIPERILVLADPAAGKTAMLQRLELVQARRARGSAAEPVPVLISLSGLKNPSVGEVISRMRERLGAAADDAFKTRRIILLADALDESADPIATARAIAQLADEFQSASSHTITRIIVTARLRNYDQIVHPTDAALRHHRFHTVMLYGLDQTAIEKQILTLTRNNPDVRKQLFIKLADSKSRAAWLQFLRLPINFELVAELLSESEEELLPRGQYQLIDKFITRRFNHRGIPPADADHCRALLAVAAANQLKLGVRLRSKDFDDTAFQLDGDTPLSPATLSIRIAQLKDTGLIEERKGRYRFFHQNILDFFISKGLQDFSVVEPSSVDWREIILFRCGMSDGRKMLEYLQKSANTNADVDALIEEARRVVGGTDGPS